MNRSRRFPPPWTVETTNFLYFATELSFLQSDA